MFIKISIQNEKRNKNRNSWADKVGPAIIFSALPYHTKQKRYIIKGYVVSPSTSPQNKKEVAMNAIDRLVESKNVDIFHKIQLLTNYLRNSGERYDQRVVSSARLSLQKFIDEVRENHLVLTAEQTTIIDGAVHGL